MYDKKDKGDIWTERHKHWEPRRCAYQAFLYILLLFAVITANMVAYLSSAVLQKVMGRYYGQDDLQQFMQAV